MNSVLVEWRPIKNYEGLYEVSNTGLVRSLARMAQPTQYIPEKLKSLFKNNGYLKVELWKNNKKKMVRVHRLVAEAFILNPENKSTVNHKDFDKCNNHIDNLEWMTVEENNKHYSDSVLVQK